MDQAAFFPLLYFLRTKVSSFANVASNHNKEGYRHQIKAYVAGMNACCIFLHQVHHLTKEASKGKHRLSQAESLGHFPL